MSSIDQPTPQRERYSRRELARLTLAGLAVPLLGGVGKRPTGRIAFAVKTSSLHQVPRTGDGDAIEPLLRAMTACDVHECELASTLIEPFASPMHARAGTTASSEHHRRGHGAIPPSTHAVNHNAHGKHSAGAPAVMSSMNPQMMRRELRKWRLRMPSPYFKAVARRFHEAGAGVYAYGVTVDNTFTDEEVDRSFAIAKTFGAQIVSASAAPELTWQLARAADKSGTAVALDAHRFSSLAEATAALKLSSRFRLAVDTGQLVAENVDPVAFIRDHHADIVSVHVTDRRRGSSAAVPWGEGDTPIKDLLQMLDREQWPMRVLVDYTAGAQTPVEEVKRCLAYARQQLA